MYKRSIFLFSVLFLFLFVVLAFVSVINSIQRADMKYNNPPFESLLTVSTGVNASTSETTETIRMNQSEGDRDVENDSGITSTNGLPTLSSHLNSGYIFKETELETDDTILSNDSTFHRSFASNSPGTLQIPYTGLTRHHVEPENARLFGLNRTTYAMLVTEVEPGSPAEKVGIRGGNIIRSVSGEIIKVGGDMILKVDGNASFVRNNEAFLDYLRDEKWVGENLTLTILRNGQIKNIELTIGAFPDFLGYENRDEGIKMKYPSDWTVSASGLSKQNIVKFFSPETTLLNRSKLPVAGVFIKIAPSDVGLDSLARTEQQDTSSTRNLDMFLVEASDLPGYERVFYDYSDSARTLKILSVFTIKDDQLFRITFAVDPPRYDDYLPLAREMIKSFQLTK